MHKLEAEEEALEPRETVPLISPATSTNLANILARIDEKLSQKGKEKDKE